MNSTKEVYANCVAEARWLLFAKALAPIAVSRRGQFNITPPTSGLKVDMMVPAESPFNRSRFARAKAVRPSPDFDAIFSSAEDVILKKMEAYREGGSEKHLRDITGVLKRRTPRPRLHRGLGGPAGNHRG